MHSQHDSMALAVKAAFHYPLGKLFASYSSAQLEELKTTKDAKVLRAFIDFEIEKAEAEKLEDERVNKVVGIATKAGGPMPAEDVEALRSNYRLLRSLRMAAARAVKVPPRKIAEGSVTGAGGSGDPDRPLFVFVCRDSEEWEKEKQRRNDHRPKARLIAAKTWGKFADNPAAYD